MALVSGARSSLNPNAPLFVPASMRQVEDFSPEWWDLVTTSTWFRDYWINQHQGEDIFGEDDVVFNGNNDVGLLPDNIDLDVDEDILNMEAQFEEFLLSTEGERGNKMFERATEVGFGRKNLAVPVTIPTYRDPIRQFEKPAKHIPKFSPRFIQQPR